MIELGAANALESSDSSVRVEGLAIGDKRLVEFRKVSVVGFGTPWLSLALRQRERERERDRKEERGEETETESGRGRDN